MIWVRVAAVLAALFVGCAVAQAADAPKRLGNFGAWQAWETGAKKAKVCYATTAAVKTQGGEKGRAPTAVAVTHRPKSPGEVSLNGAYDFKPNGAIEVAIEKNKFAFFAQGVSAWTKQNGADKQVLAAMTKKTAHELVVHAVPVKGKPVADTVSLDGFPQALAAIDKACGVKR